MSCDGRKRNVPHSILKMDEEELSKPYYQVSGSWSWGGFQKGVVPLWFDPQNRTITDIMLAEKTFSWDHSTTARMMMEVAKRRTQRKIQKGDRFRAKNYPTGVKLEKFVARRDVSSEEGSQGDESDSASRAKNRWKTSRKQKKTKKQQFSGGFMDFMSDEADLRKILGNLLKDKKTPRGINGNPEKVSNRNNRRLRKAHELIEGQYNSLDSEQQSILWKEKRKRQQRLRRKTSTFHKQFPHAEFGSKIDKSAVISRMMYGDIAETTVKKSKK